MGGSVCGVQSLSDDNDSAIRLSWDDKYILLERPWPFLSDASERLHAFEEAFSKRKMRRELSAEWEVRLGLSALDDCEFDELEEVLECNVGGVAGAIRQQMISGSGDLSVLLPARAQYYDQLVGAVAAAQTLEQFVASEAIAHVPAVLGFGAKAGIDRILLALPQASSSALADFSEFDEQDVVGAYEWLASKGDRFLQVAALEVGFAHLDRFPALEPHLTWVILDLKEDDPAAKDGRLAFVRTSSSSLTVRAPDPVFFGTGHRFGAVCA